MWTWVDMCDPSIGQRARGNMALECEDMCHADGLESQDIMERNVDLGSPACCCIPSLGLSPDLLERILHIVR